MRYTVPWQDMRRIRTQRLTASIMQEILPLLNDDQPRDVREAIYNLLWRSGAEVLTDYERKEIGLPDRNNDGWTDDELRALEARRLEVMLSPMPSIFIDNNKDKP